MLLQQVYAGVLSWVFRWCDMPQRGPRLRHCVGNSGLSLWRREAMLALTAHLNRNETGEDEFLVDFYISRNEAKVGSKDSQWALVAVTKDVITGAIDIVGWCRAADFADALPIDPTTWGHWSSALISMDETTLIEGLPLDR